MTMIKYIAKKEFKYDGREVKRGEVVEPAGGKWDEKIFNESSGFVTVQPADKPPALKTRKSGGK
jgi:hypothetical protein